MAAGCSKPAIFRHDSFLCGHCGFFARREEVGKDLSHHCLQALWFGYGELSADLSGIPQTCIFLCLLSAVSMAIYMHLSGRTANDLPPVQRGMTVCFGACLFATVICPDFFVSGVVERGIWKYGFILGAAGLVFPVILFGIGAARISTGLATIMASSELPAGILMTVIVLGESLDALRVFGIIAIMLGVVIAQLPDLVGERKEACLNMSEQALF